MFPVGICANKASLTPEKYDNGLNRGESCDVSPSPTTSTYASTSTISGEKPDSLYVQDIRGHGYDGAGNMRGE
ncbi:hypothetical protein L2E82_13695 [Cichorium intybus]|uniref:Uncharacterized protein n=1 Tax=Cichorium intybus TaxID=13427 RepID=A0ACB9EYB8_CICIN|nr:hypothetical protein L2E82_13695 [Cichorium intybus]